MNAIEYMCYELFSKYGLDDGGAIAQIVQPAFEAHLAARLPAWEFNFIYDHNPRLFQAKPANGEWICLNGIVNLNGLPVDFQAAIHDFLPKFQEILAWWSSMPSFEEVPSSSAPGASAPCF